MRFIAIIVVPTREVIMKLSEIKQGMCLEGVLPGQSVQVIQSIPAGGAINLFYQTIDSKLDSVTLFESDEEKIRVCASASERSYDADANGFLLAAEALRIKYSYVFDSRIAIHTSIIEPLPHQITAVYEDMLPKQPLRFLLADDPGAGKTIMSGLLIKELMIRGEVEHCLIVCPGSLVQQWAEDELGPKFGLHFRILTNDMVDTTRTGNPFRDTPLLVASMDKLARDERMQEMLREVTWDLVVIDESHKMAAHVNGRKIDYTRRYHLGELLSATTRNLLMLTATPHNGKEADFQEYMKLLDRDRFEGGARSGLKAPLDDIMRRLQKEELLTFEGKPLFPMREAHTAAYSLAPDEKALYEDVTDYVREGFNRANRIVSTDKRNAVGFALTSLQRRLASSPAAAYLSLSRRRKRLEERATEVREHGTYTVNSTTRDGGYSWSSDEEWDSEDLEDEQDTPEGIVVLDTATASETLDELEAEIAVLKGLESRAQIVLHAGNDRKWRELLDLLESKTMRAADGRREKLIIFTEYTDTLDYLETKLASYLGSHDRLRSICGGMNHDQRRQVEADFKQNDNVSILVATDAAGEGINLQTAHLLINYDLPWNPNRIEQRFGRIHRIGQRHTCYMYNLVADGTREGEVWHRLFDKLEQQRLTLGGRVFDVLGQVTYDDKSLSELLLDAVLEDQTPERQGYLDRVLDSSLDTEHLKRIMASDVLATDSLDLDDVTRVRTDIERANAMRLQPHYIRSFFSVALSDLGGKLTSNGDGTFRIRRVPLSLAVRSDNGARRPLSESYGSLAFDKEDVKDSGKTDLVCVGHPLLDAAVEETLAKHESSLAAGTILIDDGNRTIGPRLMLCFSLSIADGAGEEVKQELYYVEVEGDREPVVIGQAPYIDYRAPMHEELNLIAKDGIIEELEARSTKAEKDARDKAVGELVRTDAERIASERRRRIDRVAAAVDKRLSHAIVTASREKQIWADRVRSGDEGARLTATNKAKELDVLVRRKELRLKELESQKSLRPKPIRLVASAAVVPSRLLEDRPEKAADEFEARKVSEKRGMDAVMAVERSLGHIPVDVSRQNVGWDIESTFKNVDGTEDVLFIESKGVAEDADQVTLSANEMRKAAGNKDSFVLAITKPIGASCETIYLSGAVGGGFDDALASFPYRIEALVRRADTVETYELRDGTCTRKS